MEQKGYALVTGGTSGIGYELARLLAADGYNLLIAARDRSALDRTAVELKHEFGIKVCTFSKDLFEVQQAFDLYNEIKAESMRVEVLVNDAGQGQYGEFAESDLEKDLAIIRLNISSLVVLTKLFLQDMLAQGSGKILNLSSIASKMPGPLQSVYHGTKAFVQSFTEAIRSENKGRGITITALLPGPTDTDFFNKAEMNDSKIVAEGKLADPKQVAKDGYEALMADRDMVVSGLKNKLNVGMSGIVPDHVLADQMKKMQAPVDENKK